MKGSGYQRQAQHPLRIKGSHFGAGLPVCSTYSHSMCQKICRAFCYKAASSGFCVCVLRRTATLSAWNQQDQQKAVDCRSGRRSGGCLSFLHPARKARSHDHVAGHVELLECHVHLAFFQDRKGHACWVLWWHRDMSMIPVCKWKKSWD